MRLAKRYICQNNDIIGASARHDFGDGSPPTKKCRYCGGDFMVIAGLWGVFEWRGDGRYRREKAIKVYASLKRAETFVEGSELVVRWIPEEGL